MPLASMNATSGGLPPATCVVSFWDALSALTFSILMVMFGCSLWKSAANFFMVGSLPTHDSKVTVTGLVGSFTAPVPLPWSELFDEPVPHADSAAHRALAAATPATVRRDVRNL